MRVAIFVLVALLGVASANFLGENLLLANDGVPVEYRDCSNG